MRRFYLRFSETAKSFERVGRAGKRGKTDSVDRRSRIRYPIALPVRFQTVLSNLHYGASCCGKTVDFASRGFLIAADETAPQVGSRIRASVDWPVPLDGTLPLQFVVTGYVVHADGKKFGVSFDSHDLRTLRKAAGSIRDARAVPGLG